MHNSMFGAFSVLYRYSNRYAIKRMKETGIDKCHPPYLLAVAQNEGCGQEDIARTMHIDKGRIAKVTKDLISEGYVRREQNENDKRGYRLYLTEKGRQVFPKLGKLERDFENMITKGMNENERRTFRELATRAAMNALDAEGLPKPPFSGECSGDHCGICESADHCSSNKTDRHADIPHDGTTKGGGRR